MRQFSTNQDQKSLDLDQLVFYRKGHGRYCSRGVAQRSSMFSQPRSLSLDQIEFPSKVNEDIENQESRLLRNSDVIEIDHQGKTIDIS